MLQKTPHKFHDFQSHMPVTGTSFFSVCESDFSVSALYDAVIGYRDLKNITGQIFHCISGISHGLHIHIPISIPYFRRNLIVQSLFFHQVTELCPVNLRQGPYRKIKISAGGMPQTVFGRDGPRRAQYNEHAGDTAWSAPMCAAHPKIRTGHHRCIFHPVTVSSYCPKKP